MAKIIDSCTMSYMVHLITGPTSSGKTEYAVKLAKKLNGEIISADSRQVYRGMRIGTGAPTLVRGIYKGIKHHLIGIAKPTKPYTVFDFQKDAFRLIDEIQKRKKTPIVVGGTGLWIRALKEGLDFAGTKPNVKLRKRLERELKQKGLDYLVKRLKRLQKKTIPSPLSSSTLIEDPKIKNKKNSFGVSFGFLDSLPRRQAGGSKHGMTATFDYKNPRRVIRALEIMLSPTPSHLPTFPPSNSFQFKTIHLSPPKDVLQKRINKRVDQMIKDGLVGEVKKLLKKYHLALPLKVRGIKGVMDGTKKHHNSPNLFYFKRGEIRINESKLQKYPALTGIGYREIIDYLQGKTTLSEAVELIKIHTRQYAKRQKAWFRKYK